MDTNILLRLSDKQDAMHQAVRKSISTLLDRGDELNICAQTKIEFWAVATRPLEANGLGFSPQRAGAELDYYASWFFCLPEPADIATHWEALVRRHEVLGKKVHDARLVAFMLCHGLDRILTLNTADFARYSEITALHPSAV